MGSLSSSDRGHCADVYCVWRLLIHLPDGCVSPGHSAPACYRRHLHRLPRLRGSLPGRRRSLGPALGRQARITAVTGSGVHPIETESYAIMARQVDLTSWPAGDREVVARMIHATADESFASSARIGSRAVGAALTALRSRAPIVCDSAMVAAGASGGARLSPVHCYLDQVAAAPAGGTRAAAAISIASSRHRDGALWVIGTAPTALTMLMDKCRAGDVRPAAVIGLPVGYVGAAAAKAELWDSPLRDVAITNIGPRGGSAVAAAAVNALARLANG